MRQGKRILGTRFVENRKVDADPPFPILLFHHYHIGQPFWILYFTYEPGVEQVLYFFVNDFALSGANFLLFCRTCVCYGSTCSLCMVISGSIPGISSWDQAKQPELDHKKSISLRLNPSGSLDPICRFHVGFPSIRGTSSISSTSGSSGVGNLISWWRVEGTVPMSWIQGRPSFMS
ncbi:hypothetical protein Bca4012_063800 [Brassica carinata]